MFKLSFEAVQDADAWGDDPRDWHDDVLIRVYAAHRGSVLVSGEPVTGPDAVFARLMNATGGDEDAAVRGAARAARLMDDERPVIEVRTVHGHSQSDWWEIVAYGPTQASVDNAVAVFSAWLCGDVWQVSAYREHECSHGDTHRELVASIGGVYADDAEAAIEAVRDELTAEAGESEDADDVPFIVVEGGVVTASPNGIPVLDLDVLRVGTTDEDVAQVREMLSQARGIDHPAAYAVAERLEAWLIEHVQDAAEAALVAALVAHGNERVRNLIEARGLDYVRGSWGEQLDALIETGVCELSGRCTSTGNPVQVTA